MQQSSLLPRSGFVQPSSLSRDEVCHSLGQPQKTGADGVQQWRTSVASQIVVLSISFSPDGKITSRDLHIDDAGSYVIKQ
jgi:hypothetical protein